MECDGFTDQEQISFLEEFIKDINKQIDEITNGRNYSREIKSLTLRINVLECEDEKKYTERINRLKEKLLELEKLWAEKEPVIQLLQEERALYRDVLNKI